jgi:predicted O-methyltransferase YrrM
VSSERWTQVDRYIAERLIAPDPVLEQALAASEAARLPPIAVSPPQGKLLYLLARVHEARTILELGTLGAYSTIWLARALPPGGRLVTIEADPSYAEVARQNIERAGLAAVVELRVGPALEQLPLLKSENPGPFDLVFIDADKENTAEYFTWAIELARPGAVIITDNVVRAGGLIDAAEQDPRVEGMRRFHELLSREPRVSATTIQTVGSKGYDGFSVALVNARSEASTGGGSRGRASAERLGRAPPPRPRSSAGCA